MKSLVWRVWRVGVLTLALLAASLATAQEAASPPQLLPLWQAQGPGGTVYLFGSIHVCRADCYPLSPVVLRRFDASTALVVEVDPQAAGVAEAMRQRMFLPAGARLEDLLGAGEHQRLKNAVLAQGLPWPALQKLNPWMLEIALGMASLRGSGMTPEQGVDNRFLAMARAQQKNVRELETANSQLELLAGRPLAQQASSLRASLALVEQGQFVPLIEQMMTAWKNGDAARIDALIDALSLEGEPSRLEMFDRRNSAMAAKIASMAAASEKSFVVVGVGHLVGPNSVQNFLAQRGYVIRQLSSAD